MDIIPNCNAKRDDWEQKGSGKNVSSAETNQQHDRDSQWNNVYCKPYFVAPNSCWSLLELNIHSELTRTYLIISTIQLKLKATQYLFLSKLF